MILPMRKVTFLGLEFEKARFLERLQEAGVVHLILPREPVEPADLARELARVVDVRKFLARKGPKGHPDENLDFKAVCSHREELGREEASLQADLVALKKQRDLAEPWGDFSVEDVRNLKEKGLEVGFFRIPRRAYESLSFEGVFHEVVSDRGAEVCFVAFGTERMQFGFSEEKIPSQSVSQIDHTMAERQARIEEIQKAYEDLAQSLDILEASEAAMTDVLQYRRAMLNTQEELDRRLFVLQCWSPIPEDELLGKIGDGFRLVHYGEEPRDEERIPVKLENPPAFESGEDLVKIYSFPNSRDFDPSPFVLYCFAVFFGMIVGDFGYGLVMLGLTFFLRRKFKSTSPLAVRLFRLMYLLSFSVMIWGIIGAGFFGMTLDPDHLLVRISVLDYTTQQGQMEIMIVAIIIGMIHICLSLAIKFFKQRDLSCLGWIVAIWAAYFLLNSKMGHKTENPPALYSMCVGLGIVFLFSPKSRNPLVRLAEGFQGLLGIVQIFSDVLSYLRLFALGVATVYIAQTFNILADSVFKGLPVVFGVIFAGVILLAGHTLNIGLSIMGGVIHGLRLNFLEWYRWCFEGDGLEYRPFQRTGERRL